MTTDQLSKVLDYHFIPGDVLYTSSLTNGTTFTTAQGAKITVRHAGNNVYINSAQLLTTDILLSNGVLHVIDNVLNPEGPGSTPNPAIDSQGPVFASASKIQSLPFTSAIPCTSACSTSSSASATGSASGSGNGSATTGGTKATSTAKSAGSTSSSKALGVAMARETGFGAAGLMVALGGAVLMI